MSSLMLFGGNDGCATSALGTSTTCVTAIRSRVGVTERFGNTAGLMAMLPMLPRTKAYPRGGVGGVRGGVAEEEGIAVGGGARARLDADVPGGAAAVLDDHLLSEQLG